VIPFALLGMLLAVGGLWGIWRLAARRRSPEPTAVPGDGIAPPGYPGYHFVERIGTGGMASVYRAERLRDGATVAIKVPLPRYVADSKFLRRFHREAHIALRFDHPNVVKTLDHGSHGLQHAMVMEHLAGEPLDHVLEAANIHRDWACAVLAQVARGLQHLHEHGIVHRDLKAANVMVMPAALRRLGQAGRLPPGAVKIMDFGIAAAATFGPAADGGVRVGTPVAMSPEQARGLSVDHRADIYALGLLAYRLLAGEPPFRGNAEAIVQQQIFHTPPAPREIRSGIGVQLDALVMRMIAKEPGERPTLSEALSVLEAFDGSLRGAPERDRLLVLVHEPEASLWQLDPSGVRPARLLMGADELGVPHALLPLPERGGWVILASERDLAAQGDAFVRSVGPDGQLLARFAPRGVGVGEVTRPVAIAVTPDGGVLLVDRDSRRVHRYRGDGSFLASFGGRGPGRGRFEDPQVLAVAHDGKIYLLDSGSRQVQRLHPDGAYDTRWAFLGDARASEQRRLNALHLCADGRLVIADADTPALRVIQPGGALGATIPLPDRSYGIGVLDVGSDTAGSLYVAARGSTTILRYPPAGANPVGPDAIVESPAPIAQMLVVTNGVP
jgi:eukaryotic-like serine/threonine-protein kinase